MTTSIIAHTLVVALAVVATRSTLEARRMAAPAEPMLLFVPRLSEPAVGGRAAPAPDVVAEPPPEGFQPMPAPSEIPSAIPPIDLRRPFDPRDFAGIGQENGVATTALDGFEPAVLLTQPTPKYPPALLSAGLAGVVLVEFVIDTTGRVEAGSIRMIESSHPAFEEAARAAVLGARFQPARLGRDPVRQITRQRVRFVAEH